MAKQVLKNVTVEVTPEGGSAVDLSDHIRSISFSRSAAEVDTTGFNAECHVTRIGGLHDGTVDIDWQQDFGTSSVYQTLQGNLQMEMTLNVDPTAGNIQDEAEVKVLITGLPTFDGGVGELSTFSTSWPFNDTVTVTLAPPTPLYTGKMVTGASSTYSGFNRHSSPGTHFGQIDEQRPTGLNTADATDDTRIIAMYLNSSGNGSLFVRTNRQANLEGKWLEVGDQYVQMTGFSSGSATIDLDGLTTWTGDAWTVGTFLTWAVYDREPTGSAALATPTSERLGTLDMTIATDGQERGFLYASGAFTFGLTDPTSREVSVPDGDIPLNKVVYDTSGGGEWDIRASSTAGAVDLKELWFRVVHQVGSGTLTEVAKGRIVGNSASQVSFSTVLGEVPSAPDPLTTWNGNTTDWRIEFWLGEPT